MQFKTEMIILAAKSSKGEFNGKPYDSTTVFYQADLQSGENFVGQVGESIKWGTSFNFERIKNLPFPFTCTATMEQVSNGKSSVLILVDLDLSKVSQSTSAKLA
ncbi:hypothetical protein NRA24_05115 [Acinetobacter baumannii]|nr:hypothetical protein [Acinetobacter baumannii]